MRLVVASSFAAFLVDAAVVTAGAVVADQEPLPPGKAEAVASATTVAPDAVTFGAEQRASRPDSGPPGEVDNVRLAVVTLLTADVAAGRLPVPVAGRRAAVADKGGRAVRARQKAEVWDASVATSKAAELENALEQVQDDSTYRAYSDNEFVVQKWQGVEVSGPRATVTLIGHQRYWSASTGWTDDPDEQWQVELVRSGGAADASRGWRLLSKAAVRDEASSTGQG